jgi:hypothetical protein
MKNVWHCLGFFLSISLVSSCQTSPINRPEIEMCITGDSGLVCTFKDETYIRQPANDICTNPTDYGTMEDYITEVERRLARCLASPKRCR